MTLAGPLATNYTMAGASGSVTIAATNLTVTAAADTKLYDGTTTAATPATAQDVQTGDSPPVGGWIESYAGKNVGTSLTLTPASLLVSDGNYGTNYNYTYTPANVGTIIATNLTVTLGYNLKTYDGTTSATNLTVITGNIQPGDNIDPSWTYAETYATANAGVSIPMIPATLLVDDSNGGNNYSYSYVTNTGEIDGLNTTTTLAVDINPSGYTTNVTFTATVAGVLPTVGVPSGSVVFLTNGTAYVTSGPLVPGIGQSTITASISTLPVGSTPITAQDQGDGNYLLSTTLSALEQVVTNNVILKHRPTTSGLSSTTATAPSPSARPARPGAG